MNREQILSLWQTCFEDEAEIPNAFLQISDVSVLTVLQEGNAVAMAGMIPVHLGELRGSYLYAVCVDPTYRGRGFFRRIMAECEEYAKERGESFLCLIAADDALVQTYCRMGYDTKVSLRGMGSAEDAKIELQSEGFRRLVQDWESESLLTTGGLCKWITQEKSSLPLSFAEYMGEV